MVAGYEVFGEGELGGEVWCFEKEAMKMASNAAKMTPELTQLRMWS
jgi:hypothetical protein